MDKFGQLHKKLEGYKLLIDNKNINDQINNLNKYISNQEKYYNSIPVNIRTVNTFNIIYNRLTNKVEQIYKDIQNVRGIDYERQVSELKAMYVNQRNITEQYESRVNTNCLNCQEYMNILSELKIQYDNLNNDHQILLNELRR